MLTGESWVTCSIHGAHRLGSEEGNGISSDRIRALLTKKEETNLIEGDIKKQQMFTTFTPFAVQLPNAIFPPNEDSPNLIRLLHSVSNPRCAFSWSGLDGPASMTK